MRRIFATASLGGIRALVLGLVLASALACAHRGDDTIDDAEVLAVTHAWISGQVVDETSGEAIEGIVVSLHSTLLAQPLQVTTDADGRFAFEYHPAGDYTLIVQAGESLATLRAAVKAGQRWEPTLTVDIPPDLTPAPVKLAPAMG